MRQPPGSDAAEAVHEETPTEVVAQQIRRFRKERGWSARVLADRSAGMAGIDRAIIANLEAGRRKGVTIDEVLMFARVLDVAPVHLIAPTEDAVEQDDGTLIERRVRLGPDLVVDPEMVRDWVRGSQPLPDTDRRRYESQVPAEEYEEQQLQADAVYVDVSLLSMLDDEEIVRYVREAAEKQPPARQVRQRRAEQRQAEQRQAQHGKR